MSETEGICNSVVFANQIPAVSLAEAVELERVEFERFVELLESLPVEAWEAPLGASGSDVHALVAQVTGSYAAQGTFAQLRRQFDPRVIRMYRTSGEPVMETIARIQVGDRMGTTPVNLISELREVGPRALRMRSLVSRPFQSVRIDLGTTARISTLRMIPFVAARNLWMHRLDVTEAAEISFGLQTEHDGRMLSIILRSASAVADDELGAATVDLVISALSVERYRFGTDQAPDATIDIDPIVLAKLSVGRRSAAATRERSRISGDVRTAMVVLRAIGSG